MFLNSKKYKKILFLFDIKSILKSKNTKIKVTSKNIEISPNIIEFGPEKMKILPIKEKTSRKKISKYKANF